MLGYTDQFLTNDLSDEWEFQPFWGPIYMVLYSECVGLIRRDLSAAHLHEYATEIQRTMEGLRTEDALTTTERDAGYYWDGKSAEGVLEFGMLVLAKGKVGAERARIRAEYDGVRALLAYLEARRLQGTNENPVMEAALMLFHAIQTAQEGDLILEFERRHELEARRSLDNARTQQAFEIDRLREHHEKQGHLPKQDNPILQQRIADMEEEKRAAVEAARVAAAEEQRQRSSKGGVAQAKFYADKRESMIEEFKATFGSYRSLAGAGLALGKRFGFSPRTAEEHLRRFASENPAFRPKR